MQRERSSIKFLLAFILVSPATIGLCAPGDTIEKYNPGHYAAIQLTDNVEDIKYLDEPAVIGVSKRYRWKDLEPQKDSYDFTAIRSDLDYLAGKNKQLVVFIIDKSFDMTRNLPEYLRDYELGTKNGYCAWRWHPVIIERTKALGQALAAEFDREPFFEGIAVQESALSITTDTLEKYDYTPEKYRDALIDILTGLSESMEYSQVFWYMNFLTGNNGYLKDVAAAMVPDKIVMSGPDILPYRTGLQLHCYPLYDTFRDKLPLACSAQWDSYKTHKWDSTNVDKANIEVHPDGYLTMEEIFLFGRDELNLNYLFWQYKYGGESQGQRNYDDAIAVIRKYPEFNMPVNTSIWEDILPDVFGLGQIDGDALLEIYSLNGTKVMQMYLGGNSTDQLNPGEFASGIYIYNLQSRANQWRGKFVILD